MAAIDYPPAVVPRRPARAATVRDPDAVGKKSIWNALFVLPYLLVFIVLVIVPVCLGMWLSFQDYDMLAGYGGPVGWRNYVELFNDRIFVCSF
jgi:multiple sugar transport system permease protein